MSEQERSVLESPERGEPEQTFRVISSGAEDWLYKPIQCLDHGFVYLVDYMGDDASIEQAARVSYGKGTRKVSKTRGLIRYLRRHHHTTPFEMVEFKFHAKMPLFVARQWVRHRTANINEYSARYSVLSNEFYIPESAHLAAQSSSNRQGRDEAVSEEYAAEVQQRLDALHVDAYELYEWLLGEDDSSRPGIARELARNVLPVSIYTEWYWKIDLHNLMHFLALRMDSHAQYEIRVYADAMARIVKDAVPLAYEAFEDYVQSSMNFSAGEIKALKTLVSTGALPISSQRFHQLMENCELSGREVREFAAKLRDMEMITEEK